MDEILEKGSCLVPPSRRRSDTGYSRVEMSNAITSSQLSTGVEYLVTVKIGRTKCKKSEASNASCPLQGSKLKKVSCGGSFKKASRPGMGNGHPQSVRVRASKSPALRLPDTSWCIPRRKKAVGLGSLTTQVDTALDLGSCFSPWSPRAQVMFVSPCGLCYYLAPILWVTEDCSRLFGVFSVLLSLSMLPGPSLDRW